LASSFTDIKGFTWDIGGHVQFSHYEDFDRVMDLALPDGWLHHQRESWVWIADLAEVFASQADRATFGALLAAERGAVDLSRCDYVEGFDSEKIAASVTRFGVAEWHFVKVAV
jgi:hypothetical protein